MLLNIPTIFFIALLNFSAVAFVWIFVARCYPKYPAARAWAIASALAALASGLWLTRGFVESFAPVAFGACLMSFSTWFYWFGIRRFYERDIPSWSGWTAAGLTFAMLVLFFAFEENLVGRLVLYSVVQGVPVTLALVDLAPRRGQRRSHGAQFACATLLVVLGLYIARSAAVLFNIGGPSSFLALNGFQSFAMVSLVFAAMVTNFAFLLMTIDKLREEVTTLAMSDDLTGIANRRQLFQRLAEECANSRRTKVPFSVLIVDLDDFKAINDTHGHAAGDECLRSLSHCVKGRLRTTDLLARIGGDEFCVVLPNTEAHGSGQVARDLIHTLSRHMVKWGGASISLAGSIGVAQWSPDRHATPEQIMAAADHALYAAKQQGKVCYVQHETLVMHPLASATLQPAAPDEVPQPSSAKAS